MRVIHAIKAIIAFILLFGSISSCKKVVNPEKILSVYKVNPAYYDKVAIQLSTDKNSIISYPVPGYEKQQPPVILSKNYFLNGNIRGLYTAYISLNFNDYTSFYNSPHGLTSDTLFKLIIDKDPFIEYWQRDDYGPFQHSGDGYQLDTALINKVIQEGNLGKYFIRLK